MRRNALQCLAVRLGCGRCQSVAKIQRPNVFSHPRWNNLRVRSGLQRRNFSVGSVSPVILAPAVFSGLVLALWTYKCLMMVVFQNKIIYMPGVPPFSRMEKVVDCAARCRPVVWEEIAIMAVDGTEIKLLRSSMPQSRINDQSEKDIVVIYFQG